KVFRARKVRLTPPNEINSDISFLAEAGWHFSSMGGPEAFWIKAQNFSHVVDPDRIIGTPQREEEIRVITGPVSRAACRADQSTYLAHGPLEAAFSPLNYESFAIEQDVPACVRAHKERYRRFFFFTDC